MKVAKLKKVEEKKQNQVIEEQYSLKKMIIIILVICIVFAIFYFITTLVVKNNKNEETNNEIVEIDSNKITLGQILDRNEEEYYVLATKESLHLSLDENIDYKNLYDNYISNYKQTENALTVYRVDLDDALNKNYFGEELNITEDLSKIKLNDEVLFKIKNNKIDKYYVGNSKILKTLIGLTK